MQCNCGAEIDTTATDCPQCGLPVSDLETDETGFGLDPGTVILEKYELIRLLGRGGMGQVYLARDNKLERQVALKTLSKEFSCDEEYKARFMREARMASALNHPNILTVYEVGSVGETLFMAT